LHTRPLRRRVGNELGISGKPIRPPADRLVCSPGLGPVRPSPVQPSRLDQDNRRVVLFRPRAAGRVPVAASRSAKVSLADLDLSPPEYRSDRNPLLLSLPGREVRGTGNCSLHFDAGDPLPQFTRLARRGPTE
jgi:hypothetical protein